MADVRIKPWHISLDGPVSEYSESLFAVGNGCLGMRGFSLQTPQASPVRSCRVPRGVLRAHSYPA